MHHRTLALFITHRQFQGARLREKSERQAAGDDISESSEESDILEELGFISPLDVVDPYISFKQALTSEIPCFSLILS